MEHQTEKKTPDVEANLLFKRRPFFEKEAVQDNIDSAYSSPGNKRNAEEKTKPVEAFDNARNPTKNKENLSMDTTMIAHYLAEVCLEVLGHNNEIQDKRELEKMIFTLNYIAEESEKLLQKHTINM